MKEPPDAKGRVVSPQPDTTDAPDKILTGSEATKRLGVPLSTIRSLVRDGSLRATSMTNGAVGLRESEIQRFLGQSDRTAQADLADPPWLDGLLRTAHTEGSPRSQIKKTLSTAMVDQPHPPKTRCLCGSCTTCQDARWERVFQEKFADPDYYSRSVERRGGSSLSWLS
jgi:excisionase family DNA binding protein